MNSNSPERELQKLHLLIQIPNFRIGLIVEIIKMMNTEMAGLIDHVTKLKLDGTEQGKFANRKVYEGRTAIWDLPSAETPLMLSPKKVIGFLLKYIYQLQQIPFDAKTNMNSVLDILK